MKLQVLLNKMFNWKIHFFLKVLKNGSSCQDTNDYFSCWKNFEPFPKCKNTYSEKISLQKQQIVFTKL